MDVECVWYARRGAESWLYLLIKGEIHAGAWWDQRAALQPSEFLPQCVTVHAPWRLCFLISSKSFSERQNHVSGCRKKPAPKLLRQTINPWLWYPFIHYLIHQANAGHTQSAKISSQPGEHANFYLLFDFKCLELNNCCFLDARNPQSIKEECLLHSPLCRMLIHFACISRMSTPQFGPIYSSHVLIYSIKLSVKVNSCLN